MNRGQHLGIDLGTSHCAMALVDESGSNRLLPIEQADGPYQIFADTLLPSILFLPAESELSPEQWKMPWSEGPVPLLGRWARQLATHNSARTIRSAKSWLCFGERREGHVPRLPLGSQVEGKLTAREVSTELLRHLRGTYLHQRGREADSLVLTVPASFDLLAREWTEDAARDAGWPSVKLLEEPLAAFYAWLDAHRETWREILKPGDLVLVCDVGGGTSDFSLISVREEQGQLLLDRCAVGRHLLLGGDNMDLALAYHLQDKHGLDLDTWQFQDLQQQARLAKEHLLANHSDRYPIALAGRGSQLFAQSLSLEVERSELEALLVEGFFPLCPADVEVKQKARSAMREVGLPYEEEAAITKHLAQFLRDFQKNVDESPLLHERLGKNSSASPWPSHLLLNGGVFHSAVLRERMLSCLQSWCSERLSMLDNPSYDHAVALGAAAFASIEANGEQLRVRSSAARSYYLGIASNEMAIPGRKPQLQGLCILPQGTEEGTELNLTEQLFDLCMGEDVSFQLFSAKDRAADQLGTLVRAAPDRLEELARVSCHLAQEGTEEAWLPVYVKSRLLTTGQLELSMQHRDSQKSWRLAFDLGAER